LQQIQAAPENGRVGADASFDGRIAMTLDHSFNRRARRSATFSDRRRRADQIRLAFEALEDRQLLSVSVSGDPNNDAASLLSYGGPGDPTLPGFDNVGISSTNGASVVYLGGGWALTANHVTIGNPPPISPGGVRFGGIQYLVDTSTIHRLHNPDNSPADVKIFKIIGDPGLPGILPSYIATAPPDVGEHVFMIGNGLSRGDQHSWTVDTSQNPWVWTETTGPSDYSGYDIVSPRAIRWGENVVDTNNLFSTGVWGYTTQLDDLAYTGVPSLTHEAQASIGDSGGPTFYFVDGKWVLSGIMIAVSSNLSGQPPSTMLFGFQTLMADLSFYRDQILEIAGVVGRHVFYNQSAFDGMDAGLNSSDDGAIATDKVAYLPGAGLAGTSNVTSYTRGINGIMIDLASNHGPLTLNDFTFKVGANNTPGAWADAPAPTGFTVRAGAGDGGSDRVEITWADNAIKNTYLQVIVEGNDATGGPNTNTGLATSDVFYFGNRVGDSGTDTPATFFQTTVSDSAQVFGNITGSAMIDNVYDYNRSGSVTTIDASIPFANLGVLERIDIPVGAPLSPAPLPASSGDDDGASAVAFTLASATAVSDSEPLPLSRTGHTQHVLDDESTSRESVFEDYALDHEREVPRPEADDLDWVDESWLSDDAGELESPNAWVEWLTARGLVALP
jgi:hypothetical protein